MQTNGRDLYQEVTATIVAELEKGVAPWVRPWSTQVGCFGGLPYNGLSHRGYRGINVWLLLIEKQRRGFTDPRWFTYNQALRLGAQVKRGARATQVIFWKLLTAMDSKTVSDVDREKTIPVLRSYPVFNAEQCEGIASLPAVEERPLSVRYGRAQALLDELKVRISFGGDMACYVPSLDLIQMPPRNAFEGEEHFWGTCLHELTHWTGHTSRLGRELSGRFGSESYAAEELVAEMGAAFLCAHLGINGRLRHPEYIGSWLKILGSDKRAVLTASTLAQHASDFVLDLRPPPSSASLEEVEP